MNQSAVVISQYQGDCYGCGIRNVPLFSFRDGDTVYFTGCGHCFAESVKRVQPNSETILLKDLLFQAREALLKPLPYRERQRLLEAIDVQLVVRSVHNDADLQPHSSNAHGSVAD